MAQGKRLARAGLHEGRRAAGRSPGSAQIAPGRRQTAGVVRPTKSAEQRSRLPPDWRVHSASGGPKDRESRGRFYRPSSGGILVRHDAATTRAPGERDASQPNSRTTASRGPRPLRSGGWGASVPHLAKRNRR